MNPLNLAVLDLPSRAKFIKNSISNYGCTKKQAISAYRKIKQDKVYRNDVYQVNLHEETCPIGPVTHLSIKRIDREPVTDWRDKQEIKNQLCGPEREGIEIYPAESRLVDGANQYHLWVLPEGNHIPIGFFDGRAVSNGTDGGEKQRTIEEQM
jgi:hypothetical protein